jgi:glycerophosphoryl diester phosphodiesterase
LSNLQNKPVRHGENSCENEPVLLTNWLAGRKFAHRGLHVRDAPENSLGAIGRAVCAGFPVEIDVRLSGDGRVVVIHDSDLPRLTGAHGQIEKTRWEDLRALRLIGTPERIPSLHEVLHIVGGKVDLLVELKSAGNAHRLARAVANEITPAHTRCAIQSFDVRVVHWFRRHAPLIPRGQIACRFEGDPMPAWQKFLLSRYAFNFLTRPHFLAHRWQDTPLSRFANPTKRPVLAWTVRSPDEEHTALQHADSIIFENYIPALHE